MAAANERPLWAMTDHVCRVCFGRVLEAADGSHAYRCSNCGLQATGRQPAVLCACGWKAKAGKGHSLRCERNPEPTPEFPSEVIATEAPP